MATVGVIGIRMDMYAVLYSIWLCTLFAMKRSVLSKVWVFYLIFIAVLLPVQYFMVIGLPPTLCQGNKLHFGISITEFSLYFF